jgi:hypothetical protein
MARYALLTVCFALAACETISTQRRPEDYAPQRAVGDQVALFSSDAAVLSDADISRVLDYKYVPPAKMRIAVLPLGLGTWSGWSEQMSVATDAVNTALISRLRTSPRIYDASFLPTILVPEKRTVPYLREAAARYQADLLLMVRSNCRSFERYSILHADQTRAFCSVEAVLLDVRTGLVPFVATATETFDAAESKRELNFYETVLKTQLEAIGVALGNVSGTMVKFLESAP